MNEDVEWLKCPHCGEKTRVKLMPDTELRKFPLFCRKCRMECGVDVKKYEVKVISKKVVDK